MKPISQILIAPVITEMTSGFMLDEKSGAYKYAFKVNPSATGTKACYLCNSRTDAVGIAGNGQAVFG